MPTDVPESAHASESPEQRFLDYVRTGDKALIQDLITEFADRSYNQARRIIGRADGAQDAMQEAYIRLVHGAKKYDGSVPFAAWLGRLVNLSALNYRARHLSRHASFSDMSDQGVAAMSDHSTTPEPSEGPEVEVLRTALDSLPERYRGPLTLHYFGGLDRKETAQALGISAWTIETRIARGLERLREKFARAGFAVTSAGLLTVFANIPTYAATPAFKASLASVASERFVAAARQISHRLLSAKGISSLVTGAGLLKATIVGVLVIAATVTTVTMVRRPDGVPMSATAPMVSVNSEYGLVGHWKLDESGGLVAADSSGNGFHGTLGDDSVPGWIPGTVAGALDFDGAASVISVGSPPALNDLTRYTIAAWIKPRGFGQESLSPTGPVRHGRIINKRTSNSVTGLTYGWSLFFAEQRFYFSQAFTIEDGNWATPDNPIALGIWQHVALTYDNSSPANIPAFYVNGKLVATTVNTTPSGSVISDSAVGLSIGNTATGGRAFDGAIDDVRLYHRILSDSDIQVLVAGGNSSRK